MSFTVGTPSWAEIIDMAVSSRVRSLAVAQVGTVESYSAARQTCTVRIGTFHLEPSEDDIDTDVVEEQATLQDVPVAWPRGRGFSFGAATLAAGDPVLLVCCDRDFAGWRRSGRPSEPDDARVHSWGGGVVAIPGVVPNTNPIPVPTDAPALASKLDLLIKVIKNTPTPAGGELITALNAAFPGIPAGTGSTPVTTTGATKMKVE